MSRRLRIFVCLSAIAAFAFAGAATAIASGPGNSAGDQQYIDPLTGTTPSPPTPSTTPTSSSPAPAATTPSAASTTTSAPTPSPPADSSTTTSPTADATLPYTGLNVWVCAAVGLALLGSGLALRRILRRAFV